MQAGQAGPGRQAGRQASRRIYKTVVPKNVYPQRHDASFYPLLVSFHLQIASRKVRNLRIGVNKLVRKVSINLLRHVKFIMSQSATSVISIIIAVPAIAIEVVYT